MFTGRRFRNFGLGLVLLAAVVSGFIGGRALAEQPHMRAALEHLRAAKGELEVAERDKGGHRVRALHLINEAIGQVEAGVQFDRNH